MFSQNNSLYGIPVADEQLNNNPYAPRYKSGGAVSNLKKMAETVRRHGRNGDTVLAHINPTEQKILKAHGGSGTINPETGLPEYGFFKKLAKIAVPVIGGLLGGPLGAIGASAVHGASTRGSGNKMKGALRGGLEGALYSALAPMVGGAMGVSPTGMAGRMMGMNGPSLLSQLGIGAAPSVGGGIGISGLLPGIGGGSSGVSGAATAPGLLSGLSGGGLLNAGLLGAGILGTLAGREKPTKEESFEEYASRHRMPSNPNYESKRFKATHNFIPVPITYNPGKETHHSFYEPIQYEQYGNGGAVYGDAGGQEDNIKAMLSPGEFVMNATAVSRAGDGNTNAGLKKMYKLQEVLMKDGATKKLPRKSKEVHSLIKVLKGA